MASKVPSSTERQVILWAVDPTQDPLDAERIVQELKTWSERLACQVQPVSMLSRADIDRSEELVLTWRLSLEQVVLQALERFVKTTHTEGFLPVELLEVDASSHREMAFEMAQYAEETEARLIFVNTQARKTWNPFRLGGFAETLVAVSRVPVLVMNSSAQPSAKIDSILFPTDFSRESRQVLAILGPLAQAFKSKIILFNQVEMPDVYPAGLDGLWPAHALSLDPVRREAEKSRRRKAARWVGRLREDAIDSSVVIQWQHKYLGAEIIELADGRSVDLIALTGNSGPVAQALLGSAVRDVLLQAHCPVLVFHQSDENRRRKNQKSFPMEVYSG